MSDKPPLPHIDLRTRIAAALEAADRIGYGTRPYTDLADAVIEALNLRTDQVGTLTRYVTEWIDNG
jgi:hypothetical protein